MAPGLVFALVLIVTILWGMLPFIPAFIELWWPKDAIPLNAVGKDSGQLSFFAESFGKRMAREGMLSADAPVRLADGSPVVHHSRTRPLPAREEPANNMVLLLDDAPLPDNLVVTRESLAQRTFRGGRASSFRAILGQQDVLLGDASLIQRWVHAVGHLVVGDRTRLRGRATSDRDILLRTDVSFDRLDAPVVRVAGQGRLETPIMPLSAYTPFIPEGAVSLGTAYWRVTGDLEIPSGCSLRGSVIVLGKVIVQPNARVEGSIKARGLLHVQANAVVMGSLVSQQQIIVEDGARVNGPLIAERSMAIGAAAIGMASRRTTISAPRIRLHSGATIYGAVVASQAGLTVI
ncbi:MAG: hypothetical protein WCK74_02505 [Gemmatimonadaceae bacterium]